MQNFIEFKTHYLSQYLLLGVPLPVYLMATVMAVCYYLLERSRFGRAFYAVGAYTYAIFASSQANYFMAFGTYPLSGNWFWLFLLIALIVSGAVGFLLGLPVLRLKGDYLAIVTLGFAEIIRLLFVERKVSGTSNLFRGLRDGRKISRDRDWQPMPALVGAEG